MRVCGSLGLLFQRTAIRHRAQHLGPRKNRACARGKRGACLHRRRSARSRDPSQRDFCRGATVLRANSPSAARQPGPAATKPNRTAPGLSGALLSTRAAPPSAGADSSRDAWPRPRCSSPLVSGLRKLPSLGRYRTAVVNPKETRGSLLSPTRTEMLSRNPCRYPAPGRHNILVICIHGEGPAGSGSWKWLVS